MGRGEGADAVAVEPIFRKIAWRILPFLMLCYTVAYLDRVNIGFAKFGMAADLGFGEAVYGLGAAIFFIGYFFFEVPSNVILHRVGARFWIARIMVSWSIVSGACAFIGGPIGFYTARFLLGLAEAGFFPGIILLLTQWFPAARRGQIVAMFMLSIPIAGLVGGPLSGLIIEAFEGMLGLAGWRWMFLVEALPALLLGLLVPFVLAERAEDVRWLSDVEKARVAAVMAADREQAVVRHGRMRDLLSDRRLLSFALVYFCCIMGQYGITFWLPTIVARFASGDAMSIGLFSALPYAVAIASMILVCRHSDRTGERRWHLMLPMIVGGLALTLLPQAEGSVALSLLLASIAAAGILTATPMFWTIPTAELDGAAAAVGIAAINSVGNLAGFASPTLVGWIADKTGSVGSGMLLPAATLVIGAGVAYALTRRPVPSVVSA